MGQPLDHRSAWEAEWQSILRASQAGNNPADSYVYSPNEYQFFSRALQNVLPDNHQQQQLRKPTAWFFQPEINYCTYRDLRFDPQNLEPNSNAVNYFHNTYRWGQSNVIDFSNSTATKDYVLGLAYTALPWWVVGGIIALTCLIMLILRFTALRHLCDRCEAYFRYPKTLSKHYIQACLALFFLQGIVGFGSAALMMNFSISETMFSLLRSIGSIVSGLSSLVDVLANVLTFGIEMAKSIVNSIPAVLELGTEVFSSAVVSERLDTLEQNAQSLNDKINNVQDQVDGILHMIDTYSILLYVVLGVVIFVSMMGPLFIALFSTIKNTCGRVCTLLFFLIPLMLSWILLGAAVLVGSAVGDTCDMLLAYEQQILYQGGVLSTPPTSQSYVYIAEKLPCPTLGNLREKIEDAISKVDEIKTLISALTGIMPEFIDAAVEEIRKELRKVSTCTIIAEIVDYVRRIICVNSSDSTVYAVLLLYISYVFMAFFQTMQFFAALFGMNMNRFALVWPVWTDEDLRIAEEFVKDVEERRAAAKAAKAAKKGDGIEDLGLVEDTGMEDPHEVYDGGEEPGVDDEMHDHHDEEGYGGEHHEMDEYTSEPGAGSPGNEYVQSPTSEARSGSY